MLRVLYQCLSALCFAVAILSFAPWASAADPNYYCKEHGTCNGCDSNCPSTKPICKFDATAIRGRMLGCTCTGCKSQT